MLSGANITPDRASLDAFKKALDYAKQQKAQTLINGHPGLFGDEIGWMEQVRSNPNGPNPFVLTVDEFAKFADIMKDCAEARARGDGHEEIGDELIRTRKAGREGPGPGRWTGLVPRPSPFPASP